jgi:hypothetical protein
MEPPALMSVVSAYFKVILLSRKLTLLTYWPGRPSRWLGTSARAACEKRRTLRFTPGRFPRVARAGADRL